MSFHISKHRSPGNALRKFLNAELESALEKLALATPENLSGVVHDVRRHVKKMRAVLRLLKAAKYPGVSKSDQHPLRDAAKQVSALRDAEVNLKTLKKLCKTCGISVSKYPQTLRLFEQQLEEAMFGGVEAAANAAGLLRMMQPWIELHDNIDVKPRQLLSGMRRIYKRDRAAFQKAVRDTSSENLHRWRKRTKDVWNVLTLSRMIRLTDPKATRKLADVSEELGDLLGEDHDLAQLRGRLAHTVTGPEKEALNHLISSRRDKLQKKIIKCGAKFFAKKPRAFVEEFAD